MQLTVLVESLTLEPGEASTAAQEVHVEYRCNSLAIDKTLMDVECTGSLPRSHRCFVFGCAKRELHIQGPTCSCLV